MIALFFTFSDCILQIVVPYKYFPSTTKDTLVSLELVWTSNLVFDDLHLRVQIWNCLQQSNISGSALFRLIPAVIIPQNGVAVSSQFSSKH